MLSTALATLQDISYSTPDGRLLFSHLSLIFGQEQTALVGRNGVGKTTLLRLLDGSLQPAEGTISRTGNIGYLPQIPADEPLNSVAEALSIGEEWGCLHRIMKGEGTAPDFAEADWTLETRLAGVLSQVGLQHLTMDQPWQTLSGGQKTRAALAGILLKQPGLLLLDEPTNNLDIEAQEILLSLLNDWQGGAVIVSHDRKLLRSMDRIIELSDLGARSYGGNWDFYRMQKQIELEASLDKLAQAKSEARFIEQKIKLTRERQERRNVAGKAKGRKGGIPKVLLGARADKAERTHGRNNQVADRLRANMQQQLKEAHSHIERTLDRNFTLPESKEIHSKTLLVAEKITGGPVGAENLIQDFSLTLFGGDRIALVGPNGAGKTTVLKLLSGALTPASGQLFSYGPVAMLDQNVKILDPHTTILDNFKRLNSESDHNGSHAALARFLFRGAAAMQKVSSLSGGELLRAGLACLVGGACSFDLLILDEPTNHLDLESLHALEDALKLYEGALLVVSHDTDFLQAIGITQTIRLNASKNIL